MDNTQWMHEIINNLDVLINKYGFHAVAHTIEYMKSFPDKLTCTMRDGLGNTWEVTPAQLKEIQAHVNADHKITAIKIFRDSTNCGLKEAKDAIEQHMRFGWPSS